MAQLNFRVQNALAGTFRAMDEVDAAAATVGGWKMGKSSAGLSAELTVGTESTTFSNQLSFPKPNGLITGASPNAWRSVNTYTGTFAAAAWSIKVAVRSVNNAFSGSCRARVRVFASVNADGSSARELTTATQFGPAVGPGSTSADVVSTITWTPGSTITLNNEYIFVAVAWEIITASGNNNADADIRTGSASVITGSNILTSDFTLPAVNYTESATISSQTSINSTDVDVYAGADATVVSHTTAITAVEVPPYYIHTAEGGTIGAAVTVNDIGSGDQFDNINIGTSAIFEYSNVWSAVGTKSYRIAIRSTAGTDYAEKSAPVPAASYSGHWYFYFDDINSTTGQLQFRQSSGGTIIGFIELNSIARLTIRNGAEAIAQDFSTTLSINTMYRVEWTCTVDGSSNATIRAILYQGHSSTPLEDPGDVVVAIAGGTAVSSWGNVRWGIASGANTNKPSSVGSMYMDHMIEFYSSRPGPAITVGTDYTESATVSSRTSVTSSEISLDVDSNIVATKTAIAGVDNEAGTETSILLSRTSLSTTDIGAYLDTSSITGISAIASVESHEIPDLGSIATTSQISTSDISAYVDSNTLASITAINSSEVYTPNTGVNYTDASTVSTKTSLAQTEATGYVDAQSVSSQTSTTSSEIGQFVDSSTAAGSSSITSNDSAAYVDSGTPSSKSTSISSDVSAYQDSTTPTGVTTLASSEIYAIAPQHLQPISDVSATWLPSDGVSPLYSLINEYPHDPSTYIYSTAV